MRVIKSATITEKVKEILLEANIDLGKPFIERIKEALEAEKSTLGKSVLSQIIDNSEIAQKRRIPLCQDTGIVVVFVELGYDVRLEDDLYEAINEGVRQAYTEGYLRKSVVSHPLQRINTQDNTPAIVHVDLVKGDKIKITVAPKGGGSENMSLVTMLIPADGVEGIKKLVLDTIFHAEGKPCPPLVVGVGIGGNLEKSAILAKKAILRDIDDSNPDPILAKLEAELLTEINELGVGPMGFGGITTALAVKVLSYPCHIASLPVAINLQCHASRHKSVII